jgi:hypothetical protein
MIGVVILIGAGMHRHLPLALPQCYHYEPDQDDDAGHKDCAVLDRLLIVPAKITLRIVGNAIHDHRDDIPPVDAAVVGRACRWQDHPAAASQRHSLKANIIFMARGTGCRNG